MNNDTLTAIDGLLTGHATDASNHTGCTAILCPEGFTPGIAVPGFAPGCRETELMRPESLVDRVHGLVLAGGSAFGLARCLRPAHLTLDGDIVFALSSRRPLPEAAGPWTENLLGALGADAVARAVVAAAEAAAGDEWEGGRMK